MSLQMICGGSGSGKSRLLYDEIIKKSIENPDTRYMIIVPEQFTMNTQKELVSLHPARCISNIDVLSFGRLAFRILEETGRNRATVLEDMGKNLILRKIAREKKEELKVLGANVDKLGYIEEIKSVISEFAQYGIGPEQLEDIVKNKASFGALSYKLQDINIIYQAFREEIKDRCITSEEVLSVLSEAVGDSCLLKDSVVAFDGFTGFTPVQYEVIEKLLSRAAMVIFTITLDGRFIPGQEIKEHELFNLSKTTIAKLSKIAKDKSVAIRDTIYVDTNYRLKDNGPLTYLEKNIFRYKNCKYTGNVNNQIKIVPCINPEQEMTFIAGEISRLVREESLRYRDISIITGDVAAYTRAGKKVMERFGIPCFMDYKRDVLHNPFVEGIRALLSCIAENYSYAAMFRYLKSGAIRRPKEDLFLLENYCIAQGKRGHKAWNQEWSSPNLDKYSEEDMLRINQLRSSIANELEPVYAGSRGSKITAGERIQTIYKYLVDNNLQQYLKEMEEYFEALGETALAKEYSQIYKQVIDLLDEYMELLGEEVMPLDEFIQIMDAGFSEIRIGIIPPGLDSVTLGDITRTRLGDIKVLFFAGVNEGIIPAVGAGGGIISQTEREFLTQKVNLAPTLREKVFIQRFYLYLNLTKPSQRLIVSYSQLDNQGNGIRPSYLINTLTGMFGETIVENVKKREDGLEQIVTNQSALEFLTQHFQDAKEGNATMLWRDLYRWYRGQEEYNDKLGRLGRAADSSYTLGQENLTEEMAKNLYGEFLKNSVTRLEKYSACAFAHFLQYGLKLQPREEYEMTSADIGSIMHEALRSFTENMVKQGIGWSTLPEELLSSMAEECVEAAAEDTFGYLLKDGARNQYMISRMKRLMKRTVWALSKQMKDGLFTQEQWESPFGYIAGPEDGPIKAWVRGRIDRMDLFEQDDCVMVRIMDYKTGNKEFKLEDFYNGLSMQLIVYLDAAMREQEKAQKHKNKSVIPAGVFYYVLDDPIVEGELNTTGEEIDRQLRGELKLKGLYNTQSDCLDALDNTGEASSLVIPMTRTKDGIRSNKSAITTTQFKALREYLNELILDKASEILSGQAEVSPYYKSENDNGCLYCQYGAVCGYDQSISGYKPRPCQTMKDDEIWKMLLKGEEEDHAKLDSGSGEGN